jgi:hypothetical protein
MPTAKPILPLAEAEVTAETAETAFLSSLARLLLSLARQRLATKDQARPPRAKRKGQPAAPRSTSRSYLKPRG